jgi:hypothetical protein
MIVLCELVNSNRPVSPLPRCLERRRGRSLPAGRVHCLAALNFNTPLLPAAGFRAHTGTLPLRRGSLANVSALRRRHRSLLCGPEAACFIIFITTICIHYCHKVSMHYLTLLHYNALPHIVAL